MERRGGGLPIWGLFRVSEAIIRLFWFILSLGLGSGSTSGENTKSRLRGLQHRDSDILELRNIP